MKFFKQIIAYLLVVAVTVSILPAAIFATEKNPFMTFVDETSNSAWPAGPGVAAGTAYVIEMNSGEALYSKNADQQCFPASITKVLTSLIACEKLDMNDTITISQAASDSVDITGQDGRFKAGDEMTVEDAIYAFLMESINVLGNALAEKVSGSVSEFVALMNERAKEIGCTNSHFNNTNGMNDDTHVTTAHDMALIFWHALRNEKFYEIDSTSAHTITTKNNPDGLNLTMHHKMMVKNSGYYSEQIKAGKTGYTSDAGHTLVSYAKGTDKDLVIVLMKGNSGAAGNYNDTSTLARYAFDNFTFINDTVLMPNGASEGELSQKIAASQQEQAEAKASAVLSRVTKITKVSTETATEENAIENSGIPTFLKVILTIIIVLIILVFLYWFVIQLIKRKRAARKREILLRRARANRLRSSRRRRDDENYDKINDF